MSATAKKLSSLLLSFVLLMAFAIFPVAALADDRTASNEVTGLDNYMSIQPNGDLALDEGAAAQAGYAEDVITAIENQISAMNVAVREGKGYIDDEFNLVIYLPGTRAVGESKVVTTWYGLTQIYMNSDEAAELKEAVSAEGGAIKTLADLIAKYEKFKDVAKFVSNVSSIFFASYSYQISTAEAAGRGIIMNIQRDLVYGGETIWFESQ